MRKYIFLFGSLFVGLVFTMMGCKGPAGPTGPAGETTMLNLDGFKEGIKCGDCHDADRDTMYFVWAKKYQWEESKHGSGGDFEENGASCAGCHTTEGFIQSTQGKTVTDHIDATPPGCFACHSPHANGDFALRTVKAVTLTSPIQGVADASFDYGKGNLCVSCHKPRTVSPKPDPTKSAMTDTITINNSRWYPHYGVQGQMLMGKGGFQFADYTYTGNSNHTDNTVIKQEGCISCHMAAPLARAGTFGGHTMNIRNEATNATLTTGCTKSGCHATGFNIDYIGASATLTNGQGSHTAVEAYLEELKNLMLDTSIVNKWNVGAKNPWVTVSATGDVSINAGSGNKTLKIRPASRAGALFNFFFVEHDLSKGSHNTRYTIELLKSSIAELQKP